MLHYFCLTLYIHKLPALCKNFISQKSFSSRVTVIYSYLSETSTNQSPLCHNGVAKAPKKLVSLPATEPRTKTPARAEETALDQTTSFIHLSNQRALHLICVFLKHQPNGLQYSNRTARLMTALLQNDPLLHSLLAH
jgi:hypothetical protein